MFTASCSTSYFTCEMVHHLFLDTDKQTGVSDWTQNGAKRRQKCLRVVKMVTELQYNKVCKVLTRFFSRITLLLSRCLTVLFQWLAGWLKKLFSLWDVLAVITNENWFYQEDLGSSFGSDLATHMCHGFPNLIKTFLFPLFGDSREKNVRFILGQHK